MASRTLEQPVKKIGNYEVIDLLGAGGMSHVYKARHATTGELVAIKVPHERVVANPVSLKRFEQEFGNFSKPLGRGAAGRWWFAYSSPHEARTAADS